MVPAPLDRSSLYQIDLAGENPAQLVLHPHHVQKRRPRINFKAHEHIDVAFRTKIFPQRGTEQR